MGKEKILIVEDERIVAVDIKRTLIGCGYQVCGIVSNSQAAIEKAFSLSPDLILMDIMLGDGSDGIITAEKILEKKDIPIIFLTAYADEETLQRARVINPFGYIIKPFEERELHATIEMAFYRHQMENALIQSEQKYRSLVESMEEGISSVDEKENFTYANKATAEIFGFSSAKELIKYNLFNFLSDNEKEKIKKETSKRKQGLSSSYELTITRNDGEERILSITATAQIIEDKYIGAFLICSDVTDLKKAQKDIQDKSYLQQKLLESAKLLSSTLDIHQVLEHIATTAQNLLQARTCAIYNYDKENQMLHPLVVIDPKYKKQTLHTSLQIDRSFTGKAILKKKTLIFNDAGVSDQGQFIPKTQEERDEKLIVTPFMVDDEVLGAMNLTRIDIPFSDTDCLLVEAYANFASSALRNARSHRKLKREIDDRKKAQEILKSTQFRLATIFNNVPNIILYERSQSFRFYSSNIFDLIGISAQELIQNPNKFTSLIHPEDNKILQKKINHWNDHSNEGMLTSWFRLRKKNGEYIWIEDRMVKMKRKDGEYYIAGVMIDNTNLKNVEEELRKSESRYKGVVEDQTELISRYSPDFKLTFANEAFCRFYRINYNHVVGSNWEDLLSTDNLAILKKKTTEITEKSPSVTFEIEIQFDTDTKRWLETTERGFFDYDNHQLIEIQSVCRDITDRKIAELEKENMQMQLMQSQKMETIGRLAGGIAHDFNNLVTAINGYSDKIKKKISKSHSIAEDLEVIQSCGKKAEKLTQQLLGFSRKQIVKPQLVDCNFTIHELNTMLQRLIAENIHLELDLEEGLYPILIDPVQLEQVLINLIMNSNDALPDGGKILVSTKNVVMKDYRNDYGFLIDSGEYVRISVKDNGSGIKDEHLKHIFEPFFTTKGQDKGTGLGLATVYGITQQNNGVIDVQTKLGVGTEFTMFFPAQIKSEPATETIEFDNEENLTGNETILLVEDDNNIREFVIDILTEFGYQVMESKNGEEALSLIEENSSFDLLVTDIKMPGISGKKVAEYFVQKNPQSYVLFMSGYTEDKELLESIKQAEVAFLQKPFTYLQLLSKIKEIVNHETSD